MSVYGFIWAIVSPVATTVTQKTKKARDAPFRLLDRESLSG
jgi:hypothetical protein